LDKEIGIHKLIYSKTWGHEYSKGKATENATHSPSLLPLPPLLLLLLQGFFPAEMVFTERAIPVLVKHGIQWVVVANNHISRACKVGQKLENWILNFLYL
jgi:hypothetical protein